MDLRGYVRALRRSWWIIVAAVLLGTAAGVGYGAVSTPIYQSSVTFFVSTSQASNNSAFQDDQYAQARVNSYAKVLNSDILAQAVIAQQKLDLTPAELAGRITGTVDLNTVLLTATVRDTSPTRALAIATGIANELDPLVRRLDQAASGSSAVSTALTVVSGPLVDPVPVSPRKRLDVLLGLVAGLALGIVAAVIRGLIDTTVRTAAELTELTGLPVLGAVAKDRSVPKSPLVVGPAALTPRAESYRHIRTALQFFDVAAPLRVILVTSPNPGEGKSVTAVNLALMMAETGRTVALVEADLRRPRLTDYVAVENAVGLTNVLAGQVDLADVMQPFGDSGLSVLPTGSVPPNPSELLGTDRMAKVIQHLRVAYELVVIDTPPLGPVTDGVILATLVDAVVLVVRQGHTKRRQIRDALAGLAAVEARVVGTVLNQVPRRGPDGAPMSSYRYDLPLATPAKLGWLKSKSAKKATQRVSKGGIGHEAGSDPLGDDEPEPVSAHTEG